MMCEYCGCETRSPWKHGTGCASCDLYNAAIAAQKAAAECMARDAGADPDGRAWLNEYGVFAVIKGVHTMIAPPSHAAPFVALKQAAHGVFRRTNGGAR
jgi:hypothetical protein